MKGCFGKRAKAYKKCNDCGQIEACSIKTLIETLKPKGYSFVCRYGKLA